MQPDPPPKPTLIHSQVFPFDRMPVTRMANGGESRAIVHGILPTGEAVALHQSTQAAGAAPNPAHIIHHTELVLIREGTIAFEHDNETQTAGPGDILFVAPGTRHALRNTGSTPATYCVIAIGGDVRT